jgi:3-phosphoshikimate 1-carboxyvinyltransferase
VEETADGMRIKGGKDWREEHEVWGDHRLAMMLAIAGSLAGGETVVRSSESVAVSYPWFWKDLQGLSRR